MSAAIRRVMTSLSAAAVALLTTDGNPYAIQPNPDTSQGVLAFMSVLDFGAVGDGVTNDAPAFQNALNSLASAAVTGVTLWIPARTFIIANTINVPSSVTIRGCAGAYLKSTMGFTGAQLNCIFRAAPGVGTKTGTLAATPALGANIISYNLATGAQPAAGDLLQISHGVSAQLYTVLGSSGVGPFTVTLDREVTIPFVGGDPCSVVVNRPSDIRIEGNGLRFTGTGDRAIELIQAYRCVVQDCHYDTSGGVMGDMAFSFDIGGVECLFDRCSADGTGGPAVFYGFALEANERSWVRDCRVTHSNGAGIAMIDCYACMILSSSVVNSTTSVGYGNTGQAFAVGSGSALGCFDCAVIGCASTGGAYGLVFGPSTRNKIDSCSFNYAATAGILGNAPAITSTWIVNTATIGCVTGISFQAGNKTLVLQDVDVSACTTSGVVVADDADIYGLTAKNMPGTINIVVASAGEFRCSDFYLEGTGASANYFNLSGVSKAWLSNGQIQMDGNTCNAVFYNSGGGELVLDKVRTTGSGTGCKGVNLANGTLRMTGACDLSSLGVFANQVVLGASAFCNRKQTVTLVGGTKTVNWPQIRASDQVLFTLQTSGGTLGTPTYTISPGVSFTVTSTSGTDTSTLEYTVNN